MEKIRQKKILEAMNKVKLKKVSFYSNKGSHIERNTEEAWKYQNKREAWLWNSAVSGRNKQKDVKARVKSLEEENRN
jgi:hypothetical protein